MSITRHIKPSRPSLLVFATLAAMFSGHSGASPQGPGVPRLELRNGVMTWVNASAFKPIPAALLKQGEAVCRIFDTPTQKHRPAGYHPRALNAEGKPFPGGGYLCVKK
jgi:hypothetical protein